MGIGESLPDLAFETFFEEWHVASTVAICQIRSDEAAGCERLKDEVEILAEPYPTVILARTHCYGHSLGIFASEGASRNRVFDRTYQIM